MSISMTAVVNIYSVCGGVETSREGEEDKRRWPFPESECVSCSSVKTGQPCMFSAKRSTNNCSEQASNSACLLLHISV